MKTTYIDGVVVVNPLNPSDPQQYPIVNFTYLLEHKELNASLGITFEKTLQSTTFNAHLCK